MTRDREEQGDEGEGADSRHKARPVPLFTFRADQDEASKEPGDERDAKVQANTLRDLPDSNGYDASLQPEDFRQDGEEDPGVDAVEEHLKDAVDGHESGHVICISFGQLIPHQHHGDAASDAN